MMKLWTTEVPQLLNLTDFQKEILPRNKEIPGLISGKRGSPHLFLLGPKDMWLLPVI